MVINLPSISAEVKLNKAENAWTPSMKAKSDPTKKEAEDPKESEQAELDEDRVLRLASGDIHLQATIQGRGNCAPSPRTRSPPTTSQPMFI